MKPEDLKDANGRWALVKVRIADEGPHAGYGVMCRSSAGCSYTFSHADIIELLPEVIEVGDRVQGLGCTFGTVQALGKQCALVEWDHGGEGAPYIRDLTLISKGAA